MSGVVGGIGKVFQAAVGGVARISQAVSAVGRTVFTAGAASGAGSMASGGLNGIISSFTGNGVLGNILSGAVRTAIPGALIGAAVGAVTGTGALKGAMMGGLGGAAMGGLGAMTGVPQTGSVAGVDTPTGLAPTGATATAPLSQSSFDSRFGSAAPAPAAPAPAAAPAGNGFMSMFQGQSGAALLSGAAQGAGAYLQQRGLEKEAQRDRDMIREREQRLTDSYDVDPRVLMGGGGIPQEAPASASAPPDSTIVQPQQPQRRYGPTKRYEFDKTTGNVITNPA